VSQPLADLVREDGGLVARWLDDPHTACWLEFTVEGRDHQHFELHGWINPLAPGEGDPDDHAVLQVLPREHSIPGALARARFDALVDDLSDAVVITDPDLVVLETNASARAMLPGISVGLSLVEAVEREQAETIRGALRTGQRHGVTFRLATNQGESEATARELRDSIGTLIGLGFTLRVQPQPQAPAELLRASPDVVWIFDLDGPTWASSGARHLLGLGEHDPITHLRLTDLLSVDSASTLVDHGLAGLPEGGSWEADLDLRTADGTVRSESLVLRHHRTEPETWSLHARRATASGDGALRDPATGLPTSAVLRDRLEQSIDRAARRGHRTCLAVYELDGFSDLVPAIGDEMASRLVAAVSAALAAQVRPGDTLARTGDARFEVVRDDVSDIRDAERFAERVRECLDEPVTVDGVRWYLALSAGVALTQPGVTTPAGLRRNGATALEQAQRVGGAHTVMFGRTLRDLTRPAAASTFRSRSSAGPRPASDPNHRPNPGAAADTTPIPSSH
jgi:diguanylate cyclase (GGDEF)-like protein